MLTTTLCAALSVAGLAVAFQTAYRRRFLRATRIAALSLLPVGLAMAGLVTLGRKIGTASADWAADLVLKPTVWTGFAVLACSVLLYGISRLFTDRGAGDGADGAQGAHGGDGEPESRRTAARAPAAVPGGSGPAPAIRARRRSSGSDSGLSDFSDVEEILKRRGI